MKKSNYHLKVFEDKKVEMIKKINSNSFSILRYPGGKRKSILTFAEYLFSNNSHIDILVEPFAGSASFSIALLEHGLVKKIALSDLDELVASMWKVIFSDDAQKLANKIRKAKIDISTWKEIKKSHPSKLIDKAFKCIYLNRTSFSGILRNEAGPMGGQQQTGIYKLDCRFNKDRIADRICELSKLRDKVLFVEAQCYKSTILQMNEIANQSNANLNIFWYFDPPYYYKANKLYRHFFTHNDHLELQNILLENSFKWQWLLSYDYAQEIADLYSNNYKCMYLNTMYTAASKGLSKGIKKELLITNFCDSKFQEMESSSKQQLNDFIMCNADFYDKLIASELIIHTIDNNFTNSLQPL